MEVDFHGEESFGFVKLPEGNIVEGSLFFLQNERKVCSGSCHLLHNVKIVHRQTPLMQLAVNLKPSNTSETKLANGNYS